LQRAVSSIASEHGDAVFVIVTGDLAHWGAPEAYAALKKCFAPLPMPVHLLLGNHDHRGHFQQAFPDTPANSDGFVQYAFSSGGLHHIALDTNEPGVSWGVFCERRAQWLRDELGKGGDEPIHLYMHHPPFNLGIGAMDRIALREIGPFLSAIEAHRHRIRHLFFGHVHRPIAGSWLGIPLSTIRGTNHQVALFLDESERINGSLEPPQYAVVLANAQQTIVHMHDFDDRSERFDL
jgi:3',5'-cyclic-AMP phosphodiesterase